MFISILFNILGIFLYLFLFWKKLREDYPANQIFSTGLFSLLGLAIFLFIFNKYLHPWWMYGGVLGMIVGLSLGIIKNKLRFYETYEAFVVSILPMLSFTFLIDSVGARSLFSFGYFIFIVILMGLAYFFDRHYKKFTWYRSGRIGFTGLTISGLFFLIRAIFASFFPFMISFTGKYEVIVSGIFAFTFFLLVFNLARQRT